MILSVTNQVVNHKTRKIVFILKHFVSVGFVVLQSHTILSSYQVHVSNLCFSVIRRMISSATSGTGYNVKLNIDK